MYWHEAFSDLHFISKGSYDLAVEVYKKRDKATQGDLTLKQWFSSEEGVRAYAKAQIIQSNGLNTQGIELTEEEITQAIKGEHPHYFVSVPLQISYLNKQQRKAYQISFVRGGDYTFLSQNGKPYKTSLLKEVGWDELGKPYLIPAEKAIYVVSPDGVMYSGNATNPLQEHFHHSTFLAGGSILFAGEVKTDKDGKIIWLSNRSVHYLPGRERSIEALKFFQSKGIKLDNITVEFNYQTYNAKELLK